MFDQFENSMELERSSSAKILLLIFCLAATVGLLAISNGSLWIDEFGTWLITQAPSVSAWWDRLRAWPDSDSQIPLYHLYMYFWAKFFGTVANLITGEPLPLCRKI